ncbi:MAG: alpha/beta fold hydrolase [Bergeyella sp.]|nr:alpha/beta fold hydrolase [Bergeyella sp.]
MLTILELFDFTTSSGKHYDILPISYEFFGRTLHSAPVVMVNHALTGNSHVAGKSGWWSPMVGKGKAIDTERYTILSFNIPGNGFDGFFLEDFCHFRLRDIASLFLLGLKKLNIEEIYLLTGGSIGGSIGWEMLQQKNNLARVFVPIATDYKTTDWIYAQCLIQKYLLESTDEPLEKARKHAMLFYRTPKSINERFNRGVDTESGILRSHSWLDYHGRALSERFSLNAYQYVNHLLMNITGDKEKLRDISADIHLVGIDTDLFYPAFEIKKTYEFLKETKKHTYYHEVYSPHGHDAFLIEYGQLKKIFNTIQKIAHEKCQYQHLPPKSPDQI